MRKHLIQKQAHRLDYMLMYVSTPISTKTRTVNRATFISQALRFHMPKNSKFFSIIASIVYEKIHYISVTCIISLTWGWTPQVWGSVCTMNWPFFSMSCTVQIFCSIGIGFLSFRRCLSKLFMKKKKKTHTHTHNSLKIDFTIKSKMIF